MDYYEEFGIPRSATPDQIRRAHKTLARLVHPDQFQDPDLKHLAEIQMTRVNEIATLLLDPVRRREYDSPGPDGPRFPSYRQYTGWGAALVVAFAWLSTPLLRSPERPTSPLPSAAVTRASERTRIAAPPPPTRNRFRQTARRSEPIPPAELNPQPASVESAPAVPDPPALPAPSPLAAAPAGAATPTSEPRATGFAGSWLYPKPTPSTLSGILYPPEYIETVIALEAGAIRGRYLARYSVTDRAISPEVMFRFEGPPGPDSASLPWVGDGGARGEVHLRLLSRDTLEVKWFATEMGKHLGLASGTAVLVRRREP